MVVFLGARALLLTTIYTVMLVVVVARRSGRLELLGIAGAVLRAGRYLETLALTQASVNRLGQIARATQRALTHLGLGGILDRVDTVQSSQIFVQLDELDGTALRIRVVFGVDLRVAVAVHVNTSAESKAKASQANATVTTASDTVDVFTRLLLETVVGLELTLLSGIALLLIQIRSH